MKKLAKITAGISTAATSLYLLALPTLAIDVNLCNPTVGGITPPGCGPGFQIGTILQQVISILLFVSFMIALVFLIIGGIRWIMSGGDKEGTQKAKDTVTSALVGLAVVLGAWILINIVIQFFTGQGLAGTIKLPNLKGT